MNTSRLSLSLKLAMAFGVISVITLIEALVVWSNVRSIDQEILRINEKLIPQNERISSLQVAIIRASLETRHAMLMRTPEKRKATFDEILRLKAEADRLVGEFQKGITSDEDRARFDAMLKSKDVFWSAAANVLPLIEQGQIDTAVTMLEETIIPARNRFLDAVVAQKEWQVKLLNDVSQSSVQRGNATELLVLVVAVITAVLGLVIALFFSRYLMRQLGGEPQDAVAAVQAVARGDLTTAVTLRPGDNASVMAAVADMRDRLTHLVSHVRRGVDSVATASNEIAVGNADLSQRTERQASGLQGTALSMQELTESVHANASSAQQATEVAALASQAAKSGAAAMNEVVSTMGEIKARSARIGDIVSTIDGIAFQTNILALNAAVEAARAGESGRGFAVVAAEVRALAQRSASAAREVKDLIGASSEKVDSGNRLVSDAGEQMREILARVDQVQALIVEIHTASDAQARRIDGVGSSVSEIDQMTQQNAALVEQSAAAAENLKRQAGELTQATGAFRIADSTRTVLRLA